MAKVSLGWRPLLGLWLGIMGVAGILQWLGPPAEPPSRDVAGRAAPPKQPRPDRDEPAAAPSPAPSAEAVPPAPVPLAPVLPAPVPPPPIASPDLPPAPPTPPAQPSSPASPPPVAQAPHAAEREDAAPRGQALLILHAARSEDAQAAAERLAPAIGLTPGQVDARAAADPPTGAVIRFYAATDHPLARRIGQELARMGYSWRIENLSDHPPSQHRAPEVWLPDRPSGLAPHG